MDTIEIKAHAKYGASNASRWLGCPGSPDLCEKAPPEVENAYAAEGTKAHSCFELLLKNRDKIEKIMPLALKTYGKEMLDHARAAVDWVLNHKSYPGSEILCETKVDASSFTTEGQFGTVDFSIVQEFNRLVVGDFKYGAGVVVEPENNPQLIYYALGISELYHHNFSEVELVVIQPRAYHHSGETVRSVTMKMDELLSWINTFKLGVLRTQTKNPPLIAGSWCKFCRAAVICPELKNKSFREAQIVFKDETGLEKLPLPNLIQIPNLATALKAADKLEHWIEKVRDHAFHVMTKGEEIDGFKLVEKRSIRKWVDEMAAREKAERLFGAGCLTAPELLSPAQFEKMKNNTAKAFVDQHTTKVSSGLTMVADSDKRPAVKPLELTFKELPE